MDKPKLKFSDVPEGWALCFNSPCPLSTTCLRYAAGQLASARLRVAKCVLPRTSYDKPCPCYASSEPVRYARGFTHLYDKVLKNDFTYLRKTMTRHLQSNRYYYEYRNGTRLLSPEQQQWIEQLFAKAGYADSVQFDAYEYVYEFPPA